MSKDDIAPGVANPMGFYGWQAPHIVFAAGVPAPVGPDARLAAAYDRHPRAYVDHLVSSRAGSPGRGVLTGTLRPVAVLDQRYEPAYPIADLAALLRDIERDAPARGSLVDRYVVPPFTVLDARAGYWRERKKRWLAWGLRSAEGRSDRLVGSGGFANAAAYIAPASDVLHPGAVSRPWAAGTSIFDPVLAEVMYRWFSPPGGRVADPFCGGSVRGAVASALGHPYTGFDLRREQVDANDEQAAALDLDPYPEWLVGDARDARWDGGPYDLVFTCPPYWHLEHYSDDPADLCNARDAAAFETSLRYCLGPACDALAPDSFAVVVLGYVRDDTGRLVDLPALCSRALADIGLVPYNELVLLTSVSTAAIRTHIFDKSRKAVPVHQRIVVAVKGDPVLAASRCGPVDVDADPATLAAWTEDT